jgi:Chlorophyll A-B binding protein
MRTGFNVDDQGLLNGFAVEPKMSYVEPGKSQFGFNKHSELLNGRLAMIGFVSALVLEVLTGHGVVGFLTSL